jgi:hypothetical protein
MNLKVDIQHTMLVDTNEMITLRRLRMTPTKRSIQGNHKKRKNVTPDEDIEESKERDVLCLAMWYLPVIDRLKRMFSNPRSFIH